ncbi:hypothetical protein ACQP2U_05985 [Nocardia sp. CA-084685]|uniref:hypothetical protein n=1 Tax=Nocardia sp. CA-084685 TaxID=3239970 RepID=UPI003D963FFB
MVQTTPWSARKIPDRLPGRLSGRGEAAGKRIRRGIRVSVASGRDNAGYLCAAIGSTATLALLFDPWLVANGPDGTTRTNAFGRISATSSMAGLWSSTPPSIVPVSGLWGLLASAAAVVTVSAIAINFRRRNRALGYLAVAASVATAAFVLVCLIYLHGQGPALRAMAGAGSPRDPGTQIGLIIRAAAGNGVYPVPGLRAVSYSTANFTTQALLAGAISVVSAVAAVAQWRRDTDTA